MEATVMMRQFVLLSLVPALCCAPAFAAVPDYRKSKRNLYSPTSSLSRTRAALPRRARSNLSFTGTKRAQASPYSRAGTSWTRPTRPVVRQPIGRPVVTNQQTVINRPQVQKIVNNTTNVTNINNQQSTIINNNYGHQNVVNSRPWRGRYDHIHSGWHAGYWNLAYRPSMWVSGSSWIAPNTAGYNFVNPYLNQSLVLGGYDYSRPFVPAWSRTSEVSGRVTEEAIRRLDRARDAFRRGLFRQSLELVESAIRLLPDDPVLHEMRALSLFALGEYDAAAAVIYPVLAAGPGSDWTSMSRLYPSSDVYVAQLANLTNFIARNPNNVAARFLLAYHLLVVGRPQDAYVQLREVLLRRPGDAVATELVRALHQPTQAGRY